MLSESLERVADGLEAAIVEAREELARAQDQLSRLEAMQQQLLQDPDLGWRQAPPRTLGTKSNGSSSNGHVSEWRMQEVLAALADEPLTARELRERTGISQSSVSVALIALEKQGLVRKAGVRRMKAGISPALWEPTP